MKILILTDGQKWIVDRITNNMVKHIPHEFTVESYTTIGFNEFIDLANKHDLVHYQNWDVERLIDALPKIKTPILFSCRSHRYPQYFNDIAKSYRVHVCSPVLLNDFPNATYIPDGIDDVFYNRDFIVGYAGRPDEYKGFDIIAQACQKTGARFIPATNVPPEKMPDYYKLIDLCVCASENEGFSTPVMECLAMNKPVISVPVGVPSTLNTDKITFVDRDVESIAHGIMKHMTRDIVSDYTWEKIGQQFTKLYEDIQ